MKHLIRTIVCLSILCPHTSFADEIGDATYAHIVEVLSLQLNFDLYWQQSWVVDQARELRLVPLSEQTYLAALGLLNGDQAKRQKSDEYQILLIRIDGTSPAVYFPGVPYTLQNLVDASKNADQLFGLYNITQDHVRQIQEKGMYFETRFVLHTRERIYSHEEFWRLRIEQLEAQLRENIEFYQYADGVIIIHDLIESDESLYGLMLANGGSKIIGLIGVMHTREPGGMYRYYCDVKETVPSQSTIDADWLMLLLRKPLIWNFHLNEDGNYRVERTAGW